MNTLYCALNRSEFNIITSYKNARDIWNALEVTYERTNQVKESKIDMLVHQYEWFKMLSSESISSMFNRMTTITNCLNAIGRTCTNAKIMSKILRYLPKTWEVW
jgi:DNA integrity scanning protein DisA with diadenylate cyclase activity